MHHRTCMPYNKPTVQRKSIYVMSTPRPNYCTIFNVLSVTKPQPFLFPLRTNGTLLKKSFWHIHTHTARWQDGLYCLGTFLLKNNVSKRGLCSITSMQFTQDLLHPTLGNVSLQATADLTVTRLVLKNISKKVSAQKWSILSQENPIEKGKPVWIVPMLTISNFLLLWQTFSPFIVFLRMYVWYFVV